MFRRTLTALLLVLASLAPGAAIAHAQTPAPCPTGVTITVAPPTAAAPTTVSTTIAPEVVIKSPAEGDANSFHVHYFVDTEPTAAGQPVPTGNPAIIHSISLTQDLGELDAGVHTVTVVLGQFNHTACETRGAVEFEVAAAATATAAPAQPAPSATAAPAQPAPSAEATTVGAPSTGSAGLADSESRTTVVTLAAVVAGAMLLVGGLGLARRRAR